MEAALVVAEVVGLAGAAYEDELGGEGADAGQPLKLGEGILRHAGQR
ncbi:MAG: hypothetical protein M3N47_14120 [Chloroflexota bacterium]|nr:hypothetical protein [Chloroflexota bacterium]